jgi:hypothetical protein
MVNEEQSTSYEPEFKKPRLPKEIKVDEQIGGKLRI